jgi:hypothetical protein
LNVSVSSAVLFVTYYRLRLSDELRDSVAFGAVSCDQVPVVDHAELFQPADSRRLNRKGALSPDGERVLHRGVPCFHAMMLARELSPPYLPVRRTLSAGPRWGDD